MSVVAIESAAARPGGHARRSALWIGLGGALLAAMVVALAVGRVGLGVTEVLRALWAWAGGVRDPAAILVGDIRLPRVLMAALGGAALAAAGTTLQGLTRNPLVSPDLVGASSGAAFGGAAMILLFDDRLVTLAGAFAGGLGAVALVLLLARQVGRRDPLGLVLCGVIVSALASALVTLATVLADPEDELPSIVYWLMGSFADASWSGAGWLALATLPAVALILALRFQVNLLALGDDEARALGSEPQRLRALLVVAVALATAGTVAVAGIVGWIGLVVAHMARLLVGADHAVSIPASALLGATLLLAVDTFARTATAQELPLSVLTAMLGTPVFLWLLARNGGLVRDV
ncbi:MAG: iron ABC transporter permease [Steroidobacteraceae bacterium]|jgi:iron complex transport system permease protein|nr:iron ABC transporter permease [Steroidobacteraceae bacterium]